MILISRFVSKICLLMSSETPTVCYTKSFTQLPTPIFCWCEHSLSLYLILFVFLTLTLTLTLTLFSCALEVLQIRPITSICVYPVRYSTIQCIWVFYNVKKHNVSIWIKTTIYNWCQGVRYAPRCSVHTSSHIEIFLSLSTYIPHENAFLCLEYKEKSCINERKISYTLLMQNQISIHMATITKKKLG